MKTNQYADYTDKELIEEAQELHISINVLDCFSAHDILNYECLLSELYKRGYEEYTTIGFRKVDEDKCG